MYTLYTTYIWCKCQRIRFNLNIYVASSVDASFVDLSDCLALLRGKAVKNRPLSSRILLISIIGND